MSKTKITIFKIGTRVKIKKDSQYANQAQNTTGTVVYEKETPSNKGWTRVKWDRGYEDNYPDKDLFKAEMDWDE